MTTREQLLSRATILHAKIGECAQMSKELYVDACNSDLNRASRETTKHHALALQQELNESIDAAKRFVRNLPKPNPEANEQPNNG